MYSSLGDFIRALDAAGELHRVRETVDPRLEIAAIANRHATEPCPTVSEHGRAVDPAHAELGGRALLFEQVAGCDFPVAINTYGSWRRMEMALGCAEGGFESIAARIGELVKPEPPKGLRDLVATARKFLPVLRTPPRTVRSGPCQEVVKLTERGEVDLTRLPIIKCWPMDGDPAAVGMGLTPEASGTAGGEGRYITLAGMHTIHARDRGVAKPSSHNIGMYRSQLIDATRLAMHWHVHHDGASHWRSWKAAGEPMPIAIVLGGESVMPYAATCPLPPGIGELLMAGFLHGRGIPLVPAKTVPLRVPANAEIVIEGYVSTECGPIDWDPRGDEPLGPGAVYEGPFGDHTGFYSLPDRYPIVEVTAITHRRDAVYPTTIVGLPPQEDYYLGKATERIMLPLLKTIIHDIADYHLPMFGCFHNAAFIQIDKAYPLQARRVMHAVWGAGQMAWTKIIVVVDRDVDVHDETAVLQAIAANCHFERDVELVRGPLDILDHAAPRVGAGTKIGFDATARWAGEEAGGVGLEAIVLPPSAEAVAQVVRSRLVGAGPDGSGAVVSVDVPEATRGRVVVLGMRAEATAADVDAAMHGVWSALEAAADVVGPNAGDLLFAVASDVAVDDWEQVLFHVAANADPGRDRVRGGGGRVGFDGTPKRRDDDGPRGEPVRDYPPLVGMPDDLEARLFGDDERRRAFGLT